MRKAPLFHLSLGCAGLVMAGGAQAVVLDGSVAGDGYTRYAVQTIETGFGDNFSELNALYAQIDGGNLYLVLTGNVESNFNKLNIFIDSQAGGQNMIQPGTDEGGTNPNNDDWAENYSGVGPSASGNGPGFMFDTGFEADYLIIGRSGNFGGDRYDLDYAVVGGGAGNFQSAFDVFGGTLEGSAPGALPNGIGIAFDNSNTGGVGGTAGNAADLAAARAVQTGVELEIPLTAIGNPASLSDIKVSAHVNNSNHDFLSNQFLRGLPVGTGNLGGDGAGNFNNDVSAINLKNFAGDQFVQLPEPASVALLGLGGLAMLRRRR